MSLICRDLGRLEYARALELQRDVAQKRREGRLTEDVLLLVEHPPVITRGRSAPDVHVIDSPEALASRNVQTVEIERGGDVTYHGPGQLVGYPILDLTAYQRDLHWYLRSLEEILIRTLSELGLSATRTPGLTGVWVGEAVDVPGVELPGDESELVRAGTIRKIASIGVHASRWVTMHGFALNHRASSLDGFAWIVPCGIDGVTMTSIESEGIDVPDQSLKELVADEFGRVFDVEVRLETGAEAAPL